jgi:hypothetical protein
MFRFIKKPSSGSHSQYLAKITGLVQCRYRRCQCYGGVILIRFHVVCVSRIIKCLISLMHVLTMKSKVFMVYFFTFFWFQ